jgi:hypothetical protein
MDAAVTGNDVGRLLQTVYARGYSWGACDTLGRPYAIDRDDRAIYLDGRLPVGAYFEALASALRELSVDGLKVLHPRPVGVHRRSS